MRLDRLLGQHPGLSRRKVQILLASKQVTVNNQPETSGTCEISQFDQVTTEGKVIQQGKPALYLMLNKPAGVVSATKDSEHKTVMDLLPRTLSEHLHIGGRLDKASSGLMLLTNDGLWSRRLTAPELKKPKVYKVTTAKPIVPETRERFAEGIYFPYENITTSPAQLEILAPKQARLTIYEGRYHQIKRMFGRFHNPVIGLHRESMGDIHLDQDLPEGSYRHLTSQEILTAC